MKRKRMTNDLIMRMYEEYLNNKITDWSLLGNDNNKRKDFVEKLQWYVSVDENIISETDEYYLSILNKSLRKRDGNGKYI